MRCLQQCWFLSIAWIAFCWPLAAGAQTFSTEMSSPLPETESTLRIGNADYREPRFRGKWEGEMGVEGSDQGKDQGIATHFGARAQFDYRLAPMLAVRATPAADFYTSRLQTRYESDDYASEISVDDSFLQFMPVHWFELRVGALSQRFLDMPLLVSRDRAFPGVATIFHVNFVDNLDLDLVADETVPTSRSLDTERDSREPLPFFFTQSAHVHFRPTEDWRFTFWGGHYSWQDLPAKVAFDSQMIGNEPSSEDPADAQFVYGFNGWFGGIRGCYCVPSSFGVEVALTDFANLDAPEERRYGQMLEISPVYDRPFWTLKMTYSYFFNESDATPAFYNPARYGNNNRVGQSIEFRFKFKKYDFSIVGQYVDSNPINFDPNQQRLITALLGVETSYVTF